MRIKIGIAKRSQVVKVSSAAASLWMSRFSERSESISSGPIHALSATIRPPMAPPTSSPLRVPGSDALDERFFFVSMEESLIARLDIALILYSIYALIS